jgi:hypothetical protein
MAVQSSTQFITTAQIIWQQLFARRSANGRHIVAKLHQRRNAHTCFVLLL